MTRDLFDEMLKAAAMKERNRFIGIIEALSSRDPNSELWITWTDLLEHLKDDSNG